MPGKVVFAMTNHADMGNTGKKTGYFLPEVAHPWQVLKEAGFEVVYVSPKGGASPLDMGSKEMFKEDPVCKAFLENEVKRLDNTLTPDKVNPSDFKALFYPGGHGPMFDIPGADNIAKLATAIYNNGGALGAVCHGTVGFIPLKKASGEWLVKGETVTCFTDSEEAAVQLVEAMPFLLETKLKEQGATFVGKADWANNVQTRFHLDAELASAKFQMFLDKRQEAAVYIVSGRLVTGQNPASATDTGKALLKLIQ